MGFCKARQSWSVTCARLPKPRCLLSGTNPVGALTDDRVSSANLVSERGLTARGLR